MSYPQDPPAELRVLSRQYALSSAAPSGSENLSLQAVNTAKLQNGALAVVWNQASGVGTVRSFYVLEKSAAAVVADTTARFNASGGGVWRRVPQAEASSTSFQSYEILARLSKATATALTAPSGDVVLDTSSAITGNGESLFAVAANGHVQIVDDGTGGAVVEAAIQQQVNGGGWNDIIRRSATLLAGQAIDLDITASVIASDPADSIELRTVAAVTVQDATVTAGSPNFGNQVDLVKLQQ